MRKIVLVLTILAMVVLSGCGHAQDWMNKGSDKKELDYDAIINSFVSDELNTYELTVGEAHAPQATLWLKSGDGSVYTSDENVVTVTDLGKVTAVGEGTAYVIIAGNTKYQTYCYHVYDVAPEADLSNLPQVDGVDFKAEIESFVETELNTYTLKIGDKHEPTAAVWANGDNCFTSDASVVTVAGNGTVTAVGRGTAYVIIKSSVGEMFNIYKYVVNG